MTCRGVRGVRGVHHPPSHLPNNHIRITENAQRTRPLRAALSSLAFSEARPSFDARSLLTGGHGEADAAAPPGTSHNRTGLPGHATVG